MLSTVAFTQIDDAATAAGGQPSLSALTEGYADAFMVGSGIALLGVLATLVLIRAPGQPGARRAGRPDRPAAESATAG